MITRQMSLEYGLAYQIAKWGFGDNIIVRMNTRMICTQSVRVYYVRIDFDDRTNLEIIEQSDWSCMTLRMHNDGDSVTRDLSYVSDPDFVGDPEFAISPEECYLHLKRLVMSMFDDLAGGD